VSFTQVFGGNTIYPSDVSYLALALDADTELQWPLETATGNNVVARIIDVTPTDAYSITMPDAMLTGVGQVTQFLNVGPDTITIKDNAGGTLLSITTGLTYTLYLTDNTTVAGTWESFQAGAATAQAQASQLAGYGLIAQGSLLSQSQPVTVFNADFTLGAGNRAAAFVWEGGLGTLTLPTASSVGNNWFVSVRNGGEGNLTITAQGADTINTLGTLVLRPEDSATVITDGISFFTVGFGQQAVFAFDYTSINLATESGDYTLTGAELNRIAYSFVGELAGDVDVILPATTQQYWVANNTTGGSYTLSVGTDGQVAPVDVPRDSRGIYYCDGTDVVKADTASTALPIAIGDGGTGATTAGGALINLGGTSVGIDVFTAVDAANARTAIGAGTGAGSVTSVSGSGGTTGLTLTGGAITTTGTLTLGGTLAVANGGTGITSFGTGVATFLGTPSSANLAAAVTDETGSGLLVFGTTPTFTTNITAPLVIGGTGAASNLILQSTSGAGTTDFIAFKTASQVERMRIISNGRVGIGTTSPTGLFNVQAAADDGFLVRGHQSLADGCSIYSVDSTNSTTKGMEIAASKIYLSTAFVGVGTATPTAALDVPGTSSTIAALLTNIAEPITVSATAATGTIALYPSTQSVLYYTSNASANWTTNITFSAGTTMNTAMTTGQTMTMAFMVTQGATAYYNNVVQVDGSTVTPKWQGAAPAAGNVSGIDVYTYTVIKTGSAAFTVLASLTPFV